MFLTTIVCVQVHDYDIVSSHDKITISMQHGYSSVIDCKGGTFNRPLAL